MAGENRGTRAGLRRFVELFNGGQYFASHDALEEEWIQHKNTFDQGLIQVAAALVHWERGNLRGACKLLRSGVALLRPYAPQREGLDLEGLLRQVEEALGQLERAAPAGGLAPADQPSGAPAGMPALPVPRIQIQWL